MHLQLPLVLNNGLHHFLVIEEERNHKELSLVYKVEWNKETPLSTYQNAIRLLVSKLVSIYLLKYIVKIAGTVTTSRLFHFNGAHFILFIVYLAPVERFLFTLYWTMWHSTITISLFRLNVAYTKVHRASQEAAGQKDKDFLY